MLALSEYRADIVLSMQVRQVLRTTAKWLAAVFCLFAALAPPASAAVGKPGAPIFGTADIGNGITLHYAEVGSGVPVVFVHGSISDLEYWKDQVNAFGSKYRAITYSRRYNYPNTNPAQPGYSAVVDADDLAAFIKTLHLGKVYIVGHSYGGLTALFLATRHPELIRAVVLAEPPAVSLLTHMPDEEATPADAIYADIQARMVEPMKRDFGDHNTDAGVGDFIDYVFAKPHAWAGMSADDRAETLRDAHEWEVMMTTGTLFPDIDPKDIAAIKVPTLIMSGAKSYPFLTYIDQDLERLIPDAESIVYPEAGHQMWYRYPTLCRHDTEAFFDRHS